MEATVYWASLLAILYDGLRSEEAVHRLVSSTTMRDLSDANSQHDHSSTFPLEVHILSAYSKAARAGSVDKISRGAGGRPSWRLRDLNRDLVWSPGNVSSLA